LCLPARVDAVCLHQFQVLGDAGHEFRYQGDLFRFGKLPEDGTETLAVDFPVVRWNAHAEQQHLRVMLPGETYHLPQVIPGVFGGETPQPVVAPEFDNHDVGLMALQGVRQSGEPAFGGIAGDTGIDYPVIFTLFIEALLQQPDPAMLWSHTIGGAQAVADHQQVSGSGIGRCHPQQRKKETEKRG